jgi:hypothetical protein
VSTLSESTGLGSGDHVAFSLSPGHLLLNRPLDLLWGWADFPGAFPPKDALCMVDEPKAGAPLVAYRDW